MQAQGTWLGEGLVKWYTRVVHSGFSRSPKVPYLLGFLHPVGQWKRVPLSPPALIQIWVSCFFSFGRELSLTALCLCFCTLHNEIPRTDPLVQVDYVRVVDLDIGASKSDICATVSRRLKFKAYWITNTQLAIARASACSRSSGSIWRWCQDEAVQKRDDLLVHHLCGFKKGTGGWPPPLMDEAMTAFTNSNWKMS
jgi:hypothetical protein